MLTPLKVSVKTVREQHGYRVTSIQLGKAENPGDTPSFRI